MRELCIVSAVIAILLTIVSGINERDKVVALCSSTTTVQMFAKYSEWDVLDQEWSHWEDPVSDKYFVMMSNLEIVSQNIEDVQLSQIRVPISGIDYDRSVSKDRYFDKFKKKTDMRIVKIFRDGDYITIDENEYSKCIGDLGQTIVVYYWYGISYGEES